MSDIAVQASFNSGEWSPSLYARVDIQKYRSGAALMENFYVDYRGGASTRTGSKYIIQAKDSDHQVRLITFQAGFQIGYEIEFGNFYCRFIYQGAPVTEAGFSITAATKANPCVLTIPGNNFITGDWIFVSGVVGMVELNERYFVVTNVAGSAVTIAALPAGTTLNSSGYTTYTSGGKAARIYTIASPYAAADLKTLKFAQSGSTLGMVFTHPGYPPYQLEMTTPTSWSFIQITFGSSAVVPTDVSAGTQLPTINFFTNPVTAGESYYTYAVTSIDGNGQESQASDAKTVGPVVDIRTYPGSNLIQWSPAAGAVAYNVYESVISYYGAAPVGAQFGFIGTTKATSFVDNNIGPDFAESPPVHQDPFLGSGVQFLTITAAGTYTTVPGITFTGGTPSVPATATAILGCIGVPTITAAGTGYRVGDTMNFGNSLVLTVTAIGAGGAITAWVVSNKGQITAGTTPANPVAMVTTGGPGTGATATITWGVIGAIVVTGAGYVTAPTVGFTAGAATATATLSPSSNGNPSVPGFFQQRLVLAGPTGAPQTFYMSRPGNYFNFDIHKPIQPDDAITGTLVSNTLNHIKSIVSTPSGMLMFTDHAPWIINGGGYQNTGISATQIVANEQAWVGANDVPPIRANYDVLYLTSKGCAVRDLTYNIYFNVFSGTDISVYASHLFYGFSINEWAWAEQPFYEVWAVRNDGIMLTLTFLKEQEFIGWSHQVTSGTYSSVASVVEPSGASTVDAVYTVVTRTVDGAPYKYIERFADRTFPNGLSSAWAVDAGIQYSGSPILSFMGAEHLGGITVTGLATDDQGKVNKITPFVMAASGFFTLPAPPAPATGYTTVTIGIAFTCKLQTLALDTGEPSIQGKTKKIPFVNVRVNQTLGLSIGSDFSKLVPMKDLIQGNVSSMLTGQPIQIVNGLYSGDARTFLDPTYTVPGQYCIEQSNPYPASVLGVFPAYGVGDDR